ncbi:MAG: glutamyl-tRNA reductase [Nitrososphaerales archaeon]
MHKQSEMPKSGNAIEDSLISGLNIHVGVIGANFKTASIAAREDLARRITIEKLVHWRAKELGNGVTEIVLLSTCNRVEIYYASEDLEKAAGTLRSLFLLNKDPELDFKTYNYADSRAIEHLFEVSSGLDSLVIGEAQILSQVRDSCKLANERGLCGPALSKLFSKACSTGKEIREAYPKFTNGFRSSVSLSVIDLITDHYGNRELKPNILLVGSGKMIKLAASSFDRRKLGRVVVAARRQPLRELQADKIVQLSDLSRAIIEQDIDAVVTATSSDDFVLKPSDVEPFSRMGRSKELLIVDISVPRNVDPQISKLFHNVTLLNLDDLRERIITPQDEASRFGEKASDLAAIRASITIRKHEFISWMKESSEIAPLMVALRKKAETIRSEELDNALMRLSNLTPGQKDVVVKMSERIIRRFLHEPTSNLRNMIRKDEDVKSKEYAYLLRELFSLDFPQSISDEKITMPEQISSQGTAL